MKQKKTNGVTISAALATSVLATALMSAAPVAHAAKSERCADVVKGGSNTCAVKSLGISCQGNATEDNMVGAWICLLYTSPSPRDLSTSRMPSSA